MLTGEADGGSTGIRTLETVTRLHAFQACAFDHSATDPFGRFMRLQLSFQDPKPKFVQLLWIYAFSTNKYQKVRPSLLRRVRLKSLWITYPNITLGKWYFNAIFCEYFCYLMVQLCFHTEPIIYIT